MVALAGQPFLSGLQIAAAQEECVVATGRQPLLGPDAEASVGVAPVEIVLERPLQLVTP